MISAFTVGAGLAFVGFLYSLVDRYRNLEGEPFETRRDRARRVLRKVSWWRVTASTLLGGVAAVVLWHGLADVLDALVALLGGIGVIDWNQAVNVFTHAAGICLLIGLAGGLANALGTASINPDVLRILILVGGLGTITEEWVRTKPKLTEESLPVKLGLLAFTTGLVIVYVGAVSPSHFETLFLGGVVLTIVGLVPVLTGVFTEIESDRPDPYEVPDDPMELLSEDERRESDEIENGGESR